MSTLQKRLTMRAGVLVRLGVAAVLWSHIGQVATPSPDIIRIEMKALAKEPMRPIEDTQYWKLISGDTDSPAASVSTYMSGDKLFEAGVSRYDRITLELRDWPYE